MRIRSYFLCTLAATSVAARHILQARQDTASLSASAATSTDGVTPSTSSVEPASTEAAKSESSAAAAAAAFSSVEAKSSQAAQSTPSTFTLVPGSTPTTTGALSSTTLPTNSTNVGDPVPLPLTPILTPAVGFAGAILMITGLAYGLVGIRNKWLYNFFGVSYLVSLAVLVLIIYCMNPPVSDGIQGAYFVGVLLSGCLCGGVGLIFRDLVEGFGCVLGGFCFSMWFLSLKDGGTITSQVGKAIFIGAFTVLVGATGLVKKTRKWGLIASIPFSGATATVLGIDCFSRAGMKEFWIYIWDINDNEFPLNTTTYPLTRGMKVEIAGIVILFLLGLASQLKLSTVLKQQLEQNKQRRQRRSAAADQGVTDSVKRLSRAVRNSIYGDKSVTSTMTAVQSSDTLEKKGFVVKERHMSRGDLEMADINRMSSRVTITGPEGEIQGSPLSLRNSNRLSAGDTSSKWRLSAANSATSVVTSQRESLRDSMISPVPSVVPLPFRVDVTGPKSQQGSLSAIEEDYAIKSANSKRASGTSWKRMSDRNSMVEDSAIREELMASGDEDKASSVAATLDDIDGDERSISGMTNPRSPMDDSYSSLPSPRLSHRTSLALSLDDGELSQLPDLTFTDEVNGMLGVEAKPKVENRYSHPLGVAGVLKDGKSESKRASSIIGATQDTMQSSAVVSNNRVAPSSADTIGQNRGATLVPTNGAQSKRSSQQSKTPDSDVLERQLDGEKPIKKSLKISVPAKPLTTGNLSQRVPDPMSRVALQYRTNEWAKHLESAAEPEDDVLSHPPSPGVQVDVSYGAASKEHTPISPLVEPGQFMAPKPVAKRASTDPTIQRRAQTHREQRLSSTPQLVRRTSGQQIITAPESATLSRRSSSGTMAWPGHSGYRNSQTGSTPVFSHQPIVESPIEAEAPRMGTRKKTNSTLPEITLLDQRDNRLKSKPKTHSFQNTARTSSTPNVAVTPATPAGSNRDSPTQNRDGSTPDPSGRASQLRRGDSRQGTYTPQPVITASQPGFDSHQPQRPNSTLLAQSQQKRENLLTNWRESLREEKNSMLPKSAPVLKQRQSAGVGETEVQRMKVLGVEKRQRRELQRVEEAQRMGLGGAKKGDLLDAHKAAMLKMQAGVGKS